VKWSADEHVRQRTGVARQFSAPRPFRRRLRHSFRLWGPNGEPFAVKSLFGGDSATRTATLQRGEYRMVCTIMNHAELGMTGRLIVR